MVVATVLLTTLALSLTAMFIINLAALREVA